MKLAMFWAALGGLSFLASSWAKKERWFKFFVSAGGFWIACGVLHFMSEVT